MLCDICHKNEAILFVEQTSKEGVKKINICTDCARERGFSPDADLMGKSLVSLFAELGRSKQKKEPAKDERACPVCGMRLSKFRYTGVLGCPECYEIFKPQILEYMKEKNFSLDYTGSMPKRLSNFRSVLTDRADVRLKLEKAIKEEDYEKAAFYRDYLHAIENKSISAPEDAQDDFTRDGEEDYEE